MRPTTPTSASPKTLHLLASHTLGLFVGGLRAGVTLATFVAILWGLSGTLTVPVGGFSITLPGYMVWVALLYAIAGTWLTDWIGRPLVRLNFDRQRYEADFRFSLVRFRENTEGWPSTAARRTSSVAFANGSRRWCATGGASCAGRSG